MTATAMVQHDAAAESGVQIAGLAPPHDLDAEGAVLSAVLLDPAALPRIEDFLLPEHFYSESHRRMYEAAIEVKVAGGPVDITTVGAWLKDRKRLEQVGGMQYMTQILDCSPAVANVRAHAVIVHERWRVRETMLMCQRAALFGYGVSDTQPYIDSVVQRIAEIARRTPGAKVEDNFAMLQRLVKQIREAAETNGEPNAKGRGIPTGIKTLDDEILGLFAGQKLTIVAPPRVGKTALAYQIAINVARCKTVVAFFSTEMTREELGIRQLSYLASVDSKRLLRAMQQKLLSAEEWQRLTMAMSEEEDLKSAIQVYDDTNISVDDVAARTKALQESCMHTHGRPLGLVVVDYVQNLRPANGYESRKKHEQIFYSTKRLKDLAKELKVPVIELAQSKNIEVDKAKGCRPHPQLGDAAECFQIERAASTAIHMWRPQERDGSYVKFCIVKQRSGEESDLDMRFHRECSRFEPLPFGPMTPVSREYIDKTPSSRRKRTSDIPEPPPGRFDDDDGSSTLTAGL